MPTGGLLEDTNDPCAHWDHILAHAGPRDHMVQLYQDQDFLNRAVCRFAGAALANGEGLILVPTVQHWNAFRPRLEAEGVDVKGAQDSGQLTIVDADELLPRFMQKALPDGPMFLGLAGEIIAQTRGAGRFSKVRWWGEMVNVLWERGDVAASMNFEDLFDRVADEQNIAIFCSFLMDNFNGEIYTHMLPRLGENHSHLIPVEDYARLERAVADALRETVGADEARVLESKLLSKFEPPFNMPRAQALLLALRQVLPTVAEPVLQRSRNLYAIRPQQNDEASRCRHWQPQRVPPSVWQRRDYKCGSADLIKIDAVSVPIVVLGRDFVVASFNRAAADALSLTPADIGRSPHAISILNGLQNLATWCAAVAGTDVPTQHDIRIGDKSFILRIAPQTNGPVSGTVLTFTNVTAFRSSLDQAIYEREYAKAILNTVPDPLVVLSTDLRVVTANRAFYSLLRASREAIQGVPLNELCDGALDLPRLTGQLKDMLADGHAFQPFEIDCDWPEIGRRIISLYACPLVLAGNSKPMALVSFHDITELKRAEETHTLLAQEVDHRAKNLLALVQATVHFSAAETPEAIKVAIEGRIQALSNVHTLLANSRWAGADLRTLVMDELKPYSPRGASRAISMALI